MRRALVVLVALAVVASTITSAAGGSVRRTDTDHALELAGFNDLIVDEPHGHLFISEGTSRVLVTDLQGSTVAVLEDLPGAEDMAMSEDGSAVYVTLFEGDRIAAIDTADLSVTALPTGEAECPDAVAVTLGLIWFAYSCSRQWHRVAALDPVTGRVTLTEVDGIYDPSFTTSPARPGTVVVGSRQSVHVIAVEAGDVPTATETAARRYLEGASRVAVSPDGSQVLTLGGEVFNLPELSPARRFTSGDRTAVAIRSDGMIAFGRDDGLSVQPYDWRTPLRTYILSSTARPTAAWGVAWGSNDAYVVTRQDGRWSTHWALRVISPRRASSISIATDRVRYQFGDRSKVTVRLERAPAQSVVSVYGSTPDGSRRLVQRAGVDSHGTLRFRVPVREATTFTATYAGRADIEGSSSSVSVVVEAEVSASMMRYQGRSGRYALYRSTATLRMGAHVSPNHGGDCLHFRAQFKVDGRWGYDGYTKCVMLSSSSRAAVYLRGSRDLIGVPIRLRAEWLGDEASLERSSDWEYARFVP